MRVPQPLLRSLGVFAVFYALGWCVLVGATTLGDGLVGLQPARSLAQHGSTVTVDRVEVRLDVRRGLYVAEVRVWLPGSVRPVSLSDIQPPETGLDDVDPSPPIGWQTPSPLTGYVPPFQVRHSTDGEGVVSAMATSDLVGRGTYVPVLGGLAAVLAGAGGAYGWYRLSARRGWRRPGPSGP